MEGWENTIQDPHLDILDGSIWPSLLLHLYVDSDYPATSLFFRLTFDGLFPLSAPPSAAKNVREEAQ